MSLSLGSDSIKIREVWEYNLKAEMSLLRNIIDDFPYVAMDTEFPGIVVNPIMDAKPKSAEYQYESLKTNVNILKLIQLGLTLSDKYGNLPTCGTDKFCIWQFNFRDFDQETDPYNIESLDLLTKSSGIDFPNFKTNGVDSTIFAELLMSSGLVLNPDVEWATFHGGYDFGYLMKILSGQLLPTTHSRFLELMNAYFPVFYDVKYLMECRSIYGGLNKLAETLSVQRVGISHQAGSDSLLTSRVFTIIKRIYFNESNILNYSHVLFGLD